MKKNRFFLIFAATLLTLSACGRSPSKSESKSDIPDSQSSEKSYSTWVDPDVELVDVEEPTVQVTFSPVADNCMVAPEIKAYVDAMRAQEVTLEKPYHFSTLYGPSYEHNAAGSDKGDGTTYGPEDTGGVDVCQMLNRNDHSNKTENYPIQLQWDNGDLTFNSAVLKYWSLPDKSDVREIELGANATSASLPNLFRATKYRVQLITDSDDVSQGFEFRTGDYQRTISMGGIGNVRDEGGYVTSYGVRTKQGLIYRGMEIIDVSISGHSVNYSADVEAANQKYMNIAHEIDLKGDDDFNRNNYSCLKQEDGVTPIKFSHLQVHAYNEFLTNSVTLSHLPEIFHILANADEEPVYFHCWGGADRTGMVAFFLNAILGVSYTDLIEDFEITTETNNKRCHMHNSDNAHFPKFLHEYIDKTDYDYDPEKTVNKNCENFLTKIANVDPDDIERIREIMIPGYETGMEEIVPQYTANEDAWDSDDNAHWCQANEDDRVRFNYEPHDFETIEDECEEASCGQEGKEVKQCKTCGKKVTVTLPKTDHDFGVGSTSKNSLNQDVTALTCYDCGVSGYQMKLKDCDGSSNISSSGKVTNASTLTWHFKIDHPGKVSFVMHAQIGGDDKAFSNGGEKGYYSLKAGNSDGEITVGGHYLSEFGATSSKAVYFEMGVVTIADSDVNENGEVAVSITFPTTQDYRHVYSDYVRILYVN